MPEIPLAVGRVLDILSLFNDLTPELSIDEISQAINLPRSTTYRYLAILSEKEFLEKRRSGVFQPGPQLLILGQTANQQRALAQIALPFMNEVAGLVGETVLLTRIAGTRSICIERVEARHNMRITFEIGQSQPLHAGASSKVLLAYLDEDRQNHYLAKPLHPFADDTPKDIETLRHDLHQVQKTGYCVTDSEVDIGVKAVAVPIFNRKNQILAALSTAGPSLRMDEEVVSNHLRVLQIQAKKLQDALIKQGY